jgi:hypothetical protein
MFGEIIIFLYPSPYKNLLQIKVFAAFFISDSNISQKWISLIYHSSVRFSKSWEVTNYGSLGETHLPVSLNDKHFVLWYRLGQSFFIRTMAFTPGTGKEGQPSGAVKHFDMRLVALLYLSNLL